MNKKKIVWLLLLAVAFGGLYVYKQYIRTNKDLTKVNADVYITAVALVKEYETNDSTADKKYSGRIIETNGMVKDIQKDEGGNYTIVLGDTASMSSVRCSMDSVHQQDAALITVGSSAIVRGACTGFNKDEMGLGSDVILNRCVIIMEKK